MIIYIDKSIADHGKENGITEDERFLFQKLGISTKSGNCFLCGDINSLKWLSQILGDVFSKIYLQLWNEYSKARSIIEEVETLIVITYEDAPSLPDFIEKKM